MSIRPLEALLGAGLMLASTALPACRCDGSRDEAAGERAPDSPHGSAKSARRGPPYVTPALATMHDQALVVWSTGGEGRTLRGTRIGADGAPIDPAPLQIAHGPFCDELGVAAFGGGYWVVWEQHGPKTVRVLGARISKEGRLLDSTPVPLSDSEGTQRAPRIACLSDGCLALFTLYRPSETGSLLGVRLGTEGAAIEPPLVDRAVRLGVKVTSNSTAIAAAGDHFLVAWSEESVGKNIVSALRLPRHGALDAATIATVAEDVRAADVRMACTPQDCLVAWIDMKPTGQRHGVHVGGVEAIFGLFDVGVSIMMVNLDGEPAAGGARRKLEGLGKSAQGAGLALAASGGKHALVWTVTTPPLGRSLDEPAITTVGAALIPAKGEAVPVALPAPFAPEMPPRMPALAGLAGGLYSFVLLDAPNAPPSMFGTWIEEAGARPSR